MSKRKHRKRRKITCHIALVFDAHRRRGKSPNTSMLEEGLSISSQIYSPTYSASAVANATMPAIRSADNTLSMISTPWSTETWTTRSVVESFSDWVTLSFSPSMDYTASSFSRSPRTFSTTHATSLAFGSGIGSRDTITLMRDKESLLFSHQMHPLTLQETPSESAGSWTVETYTNAGFERFCDINVKYPWSPETWVDSGVSDYPSSSTSCSYKVSRVTLSDEEGNYIPMNYTRSRPKIRYPFLEWMIVKQYGISHCDF